MKSLSRCSLGVEEYSKHLNQGNVHVYRCDNLSYTMASFKTWKCEKLGENLHKNITRYLSILRWKMKKSSGDFYRSFELTCKSCFAASAPALVLNVTNPTGCIKFEMINYFSHRLLTVKIHSPRLSFHSCWLLSTATLHSLHKLWTISTTHAALRPSAIH